MFSPWNPGEMRSANQVLARNRAHVAQGKGPVAEIGSERSPDTIKQTSIVNALLQSQEEITHLRI